MQEKTGKTSLASLCANICVPPVTGLPVVLSAQPNPGFAGSGAKGPAGVWEARRGTALAALSLKAQPGEGGSASAWQSEGGEGTVLRLGPKWETQWVVRDGKRKQWGSGGGEKGAGVWDTGPQGHRAGNCVRKIQAMGSARL